MGQPSRLRYFDYFRALAIFLIVAGHSLTFWYMDTEAEVFLQIVLVGNTALFVFISGFFFELLRDRYVYKDYISKKFIKLFIPYVVMSTLAVIAFILLQDIGHVWLRENSNSFIELYLMAIALGRALPAYWYIPFIMLIILASPAFIAYSKAPIKVKLVLLAAATVIAMVTHRPVLNLNPLQSMVYYIPIYMMGIVFAQYHSRINQTLKGKELWLLLAMVGFTFLHMWLPQSAAVFAGYLALLDWTLICKIFFIMLLFVGLQRLETIALPQLSYVAAISFPIFFLHEWIMIGLRHSIAGTPLHALPGAVHFMIFLVIGFLGSIVIAESIRRLVPRLSPYIIGP